MLITVFGNEVFFSVIQRILPKNMNVRTNGLSIHKALKNLHTPRSENSFP